MVGTSSSISGPELGFPMPFYVTKKHYGLPIALSLDNTTNSEQPVVATPIEGYVWFQGDCVPVGFQAPPDDDTPPPSDPNFDNILDADGNVVVGIALADEDDCTFPRPHYLLADGMYYPLAYTDDGQPQEGFLRHPQNPGLLVPVGLQLTDGSNQVSESSPLLGMVRTMNGQCVSGVPVHNTAGWSTHYTGGILPDTSIRPDDHLPQTPDSFRNRDAYSQTSDVSQDPALVISAFPPTAKSQDNINLPAAYAQTHTHSSSTSSDVYRVASAQPAIMHTTIESSPVDFPPRLRSFERPPIVSDNVSRPNQVCTLQTTCPPSVPIDQFSGPQYTQIVRPSGPLPTNVAGAAQSQIYTASTNYQPINLGNQFQTPIYHADPSTIPRISSQISPLKAAYNAQQERSSDYTMPEVRPVSALNSQVTRYYPTEPTPIPNINYTPPKPLEVYSPSYHTNRSFEIPAYTQYIDPAVTVTRSVATPASIPTHTIIQNRPMAPPLPISTIDTVNRAERAEVSQTPTSARTVSISTAPQGTMNVSVPPINSTPTTESVLVAADHTMASKVDAPSTGAVVMNRNETAVASSVIGSVAPSSYNVQVGRGYSQASNAMKLPTYTGPSQYQLPAPTYEAPSSITPTISTGGFATSPLAPRRQISQVVTKPVNHNLTYTPLSRMYGAPTSVPRADLAPAVEVRSRRGSDSSSASASASTSTSITNEDGETKPPVASIPPKRSWSLFCFCQPAVKAPLRKNSPTRRFNKDHASYHTVEEDKRSHRAHEKRSSRIC